MDLRYRILVLNQYFQLKCSSTLRKGLDLEANNNLVRDDMFTDTTGHKLRLLCHVISKRMRIEEGG